MKIKKILFISLFLIIGLLLFIPNTVNADSIEISEVTIDFDGAVPEAGEAPKDIVINSEKYEIVCQEWYECDENGNVTNNKVTTFEYGKTYNLDMYVKAKEGYTFSNTQISTKNIVWNDDYGKLIVTDPDHPYYGCLYIEGDYTIGKVHADIEIEGTTNIIPIVGGTPQYLTISSDEFVVYSQEWYDENLNKVTTFEEGKQYYYILTLKHKTAPGWDNQSSIEIKNIDWITEYLVSEISSGTLIFGGALNPVEGFEIKIELNENVTIGQDGPLVGPKGYNRNLIIIPNEGYKITSVKVNGVEQTLSLENVELTFSNIQEDINIVVETEKVEIEDNESSTGEVPALKQINLTDDSVNQEFIKGTDKTLTFILINNRGNGKVFIDGIELNKDNGDYSWEWAENLPYIKISETYLTTLKSGKHTIKFVIDNNVGEAETTFTIVEPEDKENNKDDNKVNVPSNDNNTNNGNANTEENNSNNPQTGDNIMLFVAILGIATMGIVVTTIVRKKSQNLN